MFGTIYSKKIATRYKKLDYNIGILRQTACMDVYPIMLDSFAFLFNCTAVGQIKLAD